MLGQPMSRFIKTNHGGIIMLLCEAFGAHASTTKGVEDYRRVTALGEPRRGVVKGFLRVFGNGFAPARPAVLYDQCLEIGVWGLLITLHWWLFNLRVFIHLAIIPCLQWEF